MPKVNYPLSAISFRMPTDYVDAWRAHANACRISFTQWVREACDARLTSEATASGPAPVDRDQVPLPFMETLAKRGEEALAEAKADVARETSRKRKSTRKPGKVPARTRANFRKVGGL